MPALDQVEHALALADAGSPDEEEADAVHVGEGAVQRGAGRERLLDQRLDAAVELRRLEPRAQDRHALLARQVEQLGRHLEPLRDEEAWQVEGKEVGEQAMPLGCGQGAEVHDLGFAQHVQALRREPPGVAGQRQSRARDLRVGHRPVQSNRAGQRLQLERIIRPLQEIAKSEHQPSAASGARRARRCRPEAVSSWRLSRSSARSSAVR